MGTVAVSNVKKLGNVWTHAVGQVVKCRITMSNSYATGGDTLTLPGNSGLKRISAMFTCSGSFGTFKIKGSAITVPSTGGVLSLAGTATAPLIKMTGGGGTPGEVGAGVDLSGQSIDVILIGRTA
jgi:hypothetical protein